MAKKYTARLVEKVTATSIGNMDILCEDVSDGYHTFKELYEHRYALFIALCKVYDNYITPLSSRVNCWKSRKHYDGTMFEGSFILGMTVTKFVGPKVEVAYHLPIELWDSINVLELSCAPKFTGYTPGDVIKRLYEL